MQKQTFKIAVGFDHAGFVIKKSLINALKKAGHTVKDFGTNSEESTDYPDYAMRVAKAVAKGQFDRGILACGTGLGMCISANKVNGIRAAVVWSSQVAKLTSQHNWSNVLCLPARFFSVAKLLAMTNAWLKTPPDRGGRHERRVKKISRIESKS